MGLAFSGDHARLALTVMEGGRSQLWIGERGRIAPMDTPPFANHPAFGPLGKIAYVAGSPVQRVYVDGKPVSSVWTLHFTFTQAGTDVTPVEVSP